MDQGANAKTHRYVDKLLLMRLTLSLQNDRRGLSSAYRIDFVADITAG